MQAETYGSRSLRLRAAVILLVLFAALGMAGFNVIAQDAPTGFDPMTATTDLTIMRAEAARSGSIRVIVGVNANTASLNGLDAAAYDAGFAFESVSAQNRVLSAVTAASANVQVNHQYDFIPFMALTVDAAGLDALAANPMVTSIESDAWAMTDMNSTLPIIGASGVGGAWDLGFTGKGFVVAVLDTGVDKTHDALAGAVVSEACYNSPGGGAISRCPGGGASSTANNSGKDCIDSFAAGCEHGTHVAGTVASRNGSFPGVAPEAKLIAINVFTKLPGSYITCAINYGRACLLSATSDQVAAMNRVYNLRNQYKIAAINMSLGGGQYFSQASCNAANTSRKNAIAKLRNANIASVIASGNNGFTTSMGAPGCITGAISVGATDDADAVASFSNSASFLALLAPGVSVTSAKSGSVNLYQTFNGTSMATPHVAGAWAVMRQGKPGASVSSVLSALKSTGEDVADNRGGAGGRVKPRIQLNDALLKLAKPGKPSNVTAPAINDSTIAVKWKDVAGETDYSIQRSPNGTSSWTEVGTKGKNATSFINNSGMVCNTTYFFRVIAWNQGIPSAPSAVVDQSTKECVGGTELLVNGSFEDNDEAPTNVPDSWKKGGSLLGDKVISNAAKAHGGTNSFQFTGNVGEAGSMISQDVLVDSINQGELLILSVFLDQQTAKPGVVIGKLIIKYSNGNPTKQISLKTPPVKSPGYVRVMTNGYIVPNLEISKVTVQLLYNASSGKYNIDDASLRVITAPGLSLPSSGAELRGQ